MAWGEYAGLGAASFLTGFLNARAERDRMRKQADEQRAIREEEEQRRLRVAEALQSQEAQREQASLMEQMRSRVRSPEEQTFAEIGERPMAPPPTFSPMAQAAGLKQRAQIPDTMGERYAAEVRRQRAAEAMAQAREAQMGNSNLNEQLASERGAVARAGRLEAEAPGGEMYVPQLQEARGEFVGPRGAMERQGMQALIGQRNRSNVDEVGSDKASAGITPAKMTAFVSGEIANGNFTMGPEDWTVRPVDILDPSKGSVRTPNFQKMFADILSTEDGKRAFAKFAGLPAPPAPYQPTPRQFDVLMGRSPFSR